jgi:hypothetical protein
MTAAITTQTVSPAPVRAAVVIQTVSSCAASERR